MGMPDEQEMRELLYGGGEQERARMIQDENRTTQGGPCPSSAAHASGAPDPRQGPDDGRAPTLKDLALPTMSKAEVAELMERVFDLCRGARGDGQKEYAHRDANAFANFDRVAERLGRGHTRESVLLTYYEKHIDGIHSYVQGHRSQREPVQGRIKDAIVYLVLLWGMVECRERYEASVEARPRCPRCGGEAGASPGWDCCCTLKKSSVPLPKRSG